MTPEPTVEVTPEVTPEATPEEFFALAFVADCPQVTTGADGFPVINVQQNCGPDVFPVERPEWEPIEIGPPVCPDWGVYHTNQPGTWDVLRLGDLPDNATGPENLTRNPNPRDFSIAPSISSDARWIAFTSTRTGNWEIFLSNVYEDDIRQVTYNTTAVDLDPVWSPTGTAVVYESNRDGNWNLYLFDVTTGVERQLTTSLDNDVNAYWSPDGTRIVFQSDRDGFWQIYELDIATGEERLISDGSGDDHSPSYSPDGTMIAFRSYRESTNSVVYVMNVDGSDVRRVSDPRGDAQNAVWSPTNRLLGYDATLDGNTDIFVYEIASGETRQVTDDDTGNYAPTWYCDSDTMLFTSNVTNDANVFSVVPLPINAPPINVLNQATQLTSDPATDQYPQQSPNEENASRNGQFPSDVKNK